MVAAGHPLTAEAGARILREGGNAVDAAVGAVLASWVAEPLLTGPGAGGYLLVAGAGEEPTLLDFFVEAPGRGADPLRARRPAGRARCPSATPCRSSTAAPSSCGTYGMTAGLAAALERWGSLDVAALAAPAAAHGPRGRRAQRRAGLRLRDPRADPRARPRSRARPSRPTAARCARATVFRSPELAETIERFGADGRGAVLHGRPRRRRGRLGRAPAAASSRAPTSPPTSPPSARRCARPTAGARS